MLLLVPLLLLLLRVLPLRLLAREIYDRLSVRAGEQAVALITGEEKRVPNHPRYWVCTVEAMPLDRKVDFLAVDEIQLATHTERGHVFTDRLLHARGRKETWFLGANTLRPLVAALIPDARIKSHTRLSTLKHRGRLKVSGLPPRTTIVAFSIGQTSLSGRPLMTMPPLWIPRCRGSPHSRSVYSSTC